MDSMGVSDGTKTKKSFGFLKIGSHGLLKLLTGERFMKVLDGFRGFLAKLGDIRDSCTDIYIT